MEKKQNVNEEPIVIRNIHLTDSQFKFLIIYSKIKNQSLLYTMRELVDKFITDNPEYKTIGESK